MHKIVHNGDRSPVNKITAALPGPLLFAVAKHSPCGPLCWLVGAAPAQPRFSPPCTHGLLVWIGPGCLGGCRVEGRCEVGESQTLCSMVAYQHGCSQKVGVKLLLYSSWACVARSVEQASEITPILANSPAVSCTLLPLLEICFCFFKAWGFLRQLSLLGISIWRSRTSQAWAVAQQRPREGTVRSKEVKKQQLGLTDRPNGIRWMELLSCQLFWAGEISLVCFNWSWSLEVFVVFADSKNDAGNGRELVLALWHFTFSGTGDFMVWGFSCLELHLFTTGQCYSVDVPGGSGDLVWVRDRSWKMFIPADSHPIDQLLLAWQWRCLLVIGWYWS